MTAIATDPQHVNVGSLVGRLAAAGTAARVTVRADVPSAAKRLAAIVKNTVASMILAAVLLGCVTVGIAKEQPLPGVAITDVQTCLPPGHIQMDGYVGRRMADCMDNLITAWDLDRIIKPFRDKTDGRDNQWRSDYWGKWFTALAWGYAHQPTAEHRQLMDRAVKELIATQGLDGNIGSFEGKLRLVGDYDVWGRQCVILGLATYYDLTHDKAALDAACRVLDCLIAELAQKKLRLIDVPIGLISSGGFNGLVPSVIVESGALLYERTGQKKYLDFCNSIVTQWSQKSKALPNGPRLIEDALAGKPAREIGAPKAYEQLYCFIGICELYRATGDRKYLDAALALARNIRTDELFINGSGSEGEVWFKGRSQQTRIVNNPAETCVTTHWIYLCWQLLRLTGDPVYADEMETSLYNALLGALMPDGHWWGYYDGLLGHRVPSWIQQADAGLSCCVVSGSRGLTLTPFWAVMQTADGPAVNLYFPGRAELKTASGGKVQIEMATDYPREGAVRLLVKPERPETFTVALRIPPWSQKTVLAINGQQQPVQPGTYAKLRREWKSGDAIALTLDMHTQVIDAPDGKGQLALKRGPIVLALDDRFVPAQKNVKIALDRSAASLADLKPNLQAAEKAGTWMAFDVPFLINGKPATLTMCDYASAGNRWTKTNRFRTWLPQPLDMATAYETGDKWHTVITAVAPATPAGAKSNRLKADRILFLGNSITHHPPAPQVYWEGDWGMAASTAEKDYVHLVVNSIAALTGKKPEMRAINVADFERHFDTYDVNVRLKDALAFKADIIVVALGENAPALNSQQLQTTFKERFLRLLEALRHSGQPVIYVRSCFWPDPVKDNIMRQCCGEVGGVFVDIGALGRDESDFARSERSYKHAGVAAHPGDKGMKRIADALMKAITGRQ
jgi:uncharacterized protein